MTRKSDSSSYFFVIVLCGSGLVFESIFSGNLCKRVRKNQVKSEKIKNRYIKFQKTIDKYIYKSYNKDSKRKEENNLTDKVKENDS